MTVYIAHYAYFVMYVKRMLCRGNANLFVSMYAWPLEGSEYIPYFYEVHPHRPTVL